MAPDADLTPDRLLQASQNQFGLVTKLILRAAAFFLLVLTVRGLFVHGLFQQPTWTAQGTTSLLWFVGISLPILFVLSLVVPNWLALVVISTTVAYTVAAVGVLPLLSVILILWSACAAGMLLPRGSDPEPESHLLLATAVGIALLIGVMNVTAHFPLNYPLVWLVLLIAPLAARPSIAAQIATTAISNFHPKKERTRWEALAFAVLTFWCLIYWLFALQPEVSPDGLAMHLLIPNAVSRLHRWPFDPARFAWSLMPMGGDWCYSVAYLLGGEYSARLFNVCVLVLTTSLVYKVARRRLNALPAALIVTVLLSNPLTALVSGSLFVENIWAMLVLASFLAMWQFHTTSQPQWMYAASILLGGALATKFGSLPFVIPFVGIAAWKLLRRPVQAKVFLIALVLLLSIGAAPYVSAALITGNPVYPFLNAIFKAPGFETAYSFVDKRFAGHLGWTSLYDFTFFTSKFYEAWNGAWGFHMLSLVPLTFLAIRKRWQSLALAAAGVTCVFLFGTFSTQVNLRYMYPILPVFLLCSAEALRQFSQSDRYIYVYACALLAAILPLNLYFLAANGWIHKDFVLDPVFHRSSIAEYRDRNAPVRTLVEYLNTAHGGDSVVFIDQPPEFELIGNAYSTTWHTYTFERALGAASAASDIVRLAGDHGIRFFVAPADLNQILYPQKLIGTTLNEFATVERRNQQLAIYRLKPQFEGPNGWTAATEHESRPITALPGRAYDDLDLEIKVSGAWTRDGQFPEPFARTLTYSDVPGASFSIQFKGTGLKYIYTKAFNRGIVDIFIDGQLWGSLDQYSRTTQWQAQSTIQGLSAKQHLTEFRVTGRRNAASSGIYVDVDGFEILPEKP